jgi:pimeloyl-ACP methyl ester carboxylesterase
MAMKQKATWRDPALGAARELELPQGRLRYFEAGSGSPIVFLHGLLVNANLWRKVVATLSHEFRCLALVLAPGHDHRRRRARPQAHHQGNPHALHERGRRPTGRVRQAGADRSTIASSSRRTRSSSRGSCQTRASTGSRTPAASRPRTSPPGSQS